MIGSDRCDHWHGLLAMEVVGQLTDGDRVALLAHLDGCPACRDDRDSLGGLATALPAADPDHFAGHDVPLELRTAVLDRLRADARRRRHRLFRHLGAVVVAGAAAAVALALVLSGSPTGSGPGRTVALVGRAGVAATARLTSEPWGTAIHLQETGQAGGQILSVSMRTRGGAWWEAGTYRTVTGRSVRVDLGCGVPLSKIGSIWVRNETGHTVLHASLA